MKKRPVSLLLLSLLFCTAFAGGRRGAGASCPSVADTVPDSVRSLYYYTEGLKQRQIKGDTVGAAASFRAAIGHDTTYAPAYYELAATWGESAPQRLDEVIRLSGTASRLDTTNKWYLQLYGQSLVLGSRYDRATEVYRRLTRLDPRNADHYRLLAALYEQLQRPTEALAVLDTATVRFGRLAPLEAMKQRLLLATGQYERATREAEALVAAEPYEASHRLALGQIYERTGRDSMAQATYSRAVALAPGDLTTLAVVGDYYNRKRNYRAFLSITRRLFESDALSVEGKVSQFERLTSDVRFYRQYYLQINELAELLALKYPQDPSVADLYGQHLIASGELDKALSLYKAHTSDRPAVKRYFTMVIDIESYKQRPDSAERYVQEAQRLFPDDAEFRIARGHLHAYAKRYNEAVKSYRASLPYATTDSLRGVIWGYIGDSYYGAGETRRCYKAYDRSLRYWLENAMVLNNYAYFLAEEGRRLGEALDLSGRAVALEGNNPTYLDTYGWVLYKLGRIEEAKKTMQLAISLDGGRSADLQLHYGDILAASGERFMAEVYWRKALENGYEDPEAISQRFERLQAESPNAKERNTPRK